MDKLYAAPHHSDHMALHARTISPAAVIQKGGRCVVRFMIAAGALAELLTLSPRGGPMSSIEPPREDEAAACMARIVASRDREAFKTLFLTFAPKVKSYLLRHGAGPVQAEELAQETLLAVWRKAEQYDAARAPVSAWIFTIARNLRIDVLRKERSALTYALCAPEPEEQPASPEVESELVEREARLREAVQGLPADQMEVVRLSFFSDKPHAEIARELSLPLGTVKSRLRLAVARLRKALGDLA
jgi:RNA polymerase sigma-70 factor (ECF subfamily)